VGWTLAVQGCSGLGSSSGGPDNGKLEPVSESRKVFTTFAGSLLWTGGPFPSSLIRKVKQRSCEIFHSFERLDRLICVLGIAPTRDGVLLLPSGVRMATYREEVGCQFMGCRLAGSVVVL
jgi:hypothetical protein